MQAKLVDVGFDLTRSDTIEFIVVIKEASTFA